VRRVSEAVNEIASTPWGTRRARPATATRSVARFADGMTASKTFGVRLDADGEGQARLVLQGELYLATAPVLAVNVIRACSKKPAELIIDLSALDYCDSSGLREFIRAAKLCAGNGTKLRVGGARGKVRRVFELTGIANVVGLEP
jgi:anti-sigma B factor antagonist